MKERIGFIGLGAMGSGMAANLLANGFPLTVLAHRRREAVDDLVMKGATEAKTARDLALASDIVVLCVTGSPQVEQAIKGADGLASAGKPLLIIDCSTSNPSSTVALAADLAQSGITLIDAPLARTPKEAAEGKLDVMAGGSPDVFARAKPVLDAFAARDPRFRVLHRATNGGITAATSDALAMATGEFIEEKDGGEMICIGSIEELNEGIRNANKVLGGDVNKNYLHEGILDLHKPYVDEIILVSKAGKPMKRVPDLIDVWFDSGAMPYAQWHFPFENKETFKQSFPADYIAEGVDQTRGWFYTLHAIGVMLFDNVAYKTVVSNGLVLDKNGNKMSKRLGNVVDPFKTIEEYSADATRWYLITNASPWDSMKFDLAGIKEVQRKFFGTLYNTYQFFALYANKPCPSPLRGQSLTL